MTKIIQFGLIVCTVILLLEFGRTGVRGGMHAPSLKLTLFAICGVLFFGLLLYFGGKSKKAPFTDTDDSAKQGKELKSPVGGTRLRKPDSLPRISLKDIEKRLYPDAPFDKTDKALFTYKNIDKMSSIFSGRSFLITEICEIDNYIPYLKFCDIPYSRDGRGLYFDFTFKTSTDDASPFVNVDCKIQIEKETWKMKQLIKIKNYSHLKKDLLVSHLKKELNLNDINPGSSINLKMLVSGDTVQLIAS